MEMDAQVLAQLKPIVCAWDFHFHLAHAVEMELWRVKNNAMMETW